MGLLMLPSVEEQVFIIMNGLMDQFWKIKVILVQELIHYQYQMKMVVML